MRRQIFPLAAVLAGLPATIAIAPPAAAATPITVTTTEDVVDAGDGETSLREAVSQANATSGADTIVLAEAATYELTICGVDEANAVGDLDATGGDGLTIEGNGATVEQTCRFFSFNPPTVPQRVIASRGTGPLTLLHVTLTRGSSSSGAQIGGSGGAIWAAGDVVVTNVTLANNQTGRCGSGAAIRAGGSVTATDSNFSANHAISEECFSPPGGVIDADGNIHLVDTVFTDNFGGGGGAVLSEGTVFVEDSAFRGTFSGVVEGFAVTLARTEITGSSVTPTFALPTLVEGRNSVTLEDTVVEDNLNTSVVRGDQILVTRSTLRRNGTPEISGVVLAGSTVIVNDSTVAANHGAGIEARSEVVAANSTIVANGGRGVFAGFDHDASVQLDHVTLVGNHHASEAANLYVRGSLSSIGSVFARPGGPSNCLATALGTNRDNVSTTSRSTTCGFDRTTRNHFRVTITNHDLGPLANNGGPTPTRRPAIGGSLSVIPPSACATPALDQRGRPRPQGWRCEAGAVEVS